MSNVWQKRRMKFKGFLNQAKSYALLRHSSWNEKKLKDLIAANQIQRLHVGCGDILLKDWLNIRYEVREEYGALKREDDKFLLNYNLLKAWPVADNSIEFIAGSHFIEHIDLNQGLEFARKSFQALRSGGVLRLSCPDLELYAKNYVEGNHDFYNHDLIREWCAFPKAETPGEIFAAKAYDSGGSHKWFYDFASLKHIMEKAGFSDVKKMGRLEGKTPDLESLELAGRELETVYVEGVKA